MDAATTDADMMLPDARSSAAPRRSTSRGAPVRRLRAMQIFSITSGKGGVGKTSLVCNIALEFGRLDRKVLLIDADMGLANVDIMMGLSPEATLEQLFTGEARVADLLVEARPNVCVLPAASGVREMTHLEDEQIGMLLDALSDLEVEFDVVLVDTGAGIGRNVLRFNAAAGDVIVVATPEPTSMTDAYALMKVLSQSAGVKRFRLVVNQVESRKQALRVYRHLTNVADQYLDIAIDFAGFVLRDPNVSQAVIERELLLERFPDSPASECIRQLVADLVAQESERPAPSHVQFFWKRLLQAGT